MSNIELKPCPFCGGQVNITNYGYGDGYIIDHPNAFKAGGVVLCPISNYEGEGVGALYYDTEQEAADAWNKRIEVTT